MFHYAHRSPVFISSEGKNPATSAHYGGWFRCGANRRFCALNLTLKVVEVAGFFAPLRMTYVFDC